MWDPGPALGRQQTCSSPLAAQQCRGLRARYPASLLAHHQGSSVRIWDADAAAEFETYCLAKSLSENPEDPGQNDGCAKVLIELQSKASTLTLRPLLRMPEANLRWVSMMRSIHSHFEVRGHLSANCPLKDLGRRCHGMHFNLFPESFSHIFET